jgi:hypothetical protein
MVSTRSAVSSNWSRSPHPRNSSPPGCRRLYIWIYSLAPNCVSSIRSLFPPLSGSSFHLLVNHWSAMESQLFSSPHLKTRSFLSGCRRLLYIYKLLPLAPNPSGHAVVLPSSHFPDRSIPLVVKRLASQVESVPQPAHSQVSVLLPGFRRLLFTYNFISNEAHNQRQPWSFLLHSWTFNCT